MRNANESQLAFDLPDDTHPVTRARREERERGKIPDEAGQRAAMFARHRREWDEHLDLWNDALYKRSEGLAKVAKLLAETLRIRQADERAAWDVPPAGALDPEARRRRIAQLAKELGLVVIGD